MSGCVTAMSRVCHSKCVIQSVYVTSFSIVNVSFMMSVFECGGSFRMGESFKGCVGEC